MSTSVMRVTVREAVPSDEAAILELYKATPELHRNTPVDLLDEEERAYHLNKTGKLLLVAVDESGSLKGFVYVGLKHRTIKEEKARLLHLAVTPDSRKSGVATQLLNECERRLKKVGIDDFYSCSNVANKAMAAFLMKHGFHVQQVYFRFEKSLYFNHSWTPMEGFDDDDYLN